MKTIIEKLIRLIRRKDEYEWTQMDASMFLDRFQESDTYKDVQQDKEALWPGGKRIPNQ